MIEFGSGLLRNAWYLLNHSKSLSVYELPEVVERHAHAYADLADKGGLVVARPATRKYDIAIATFVLGSITPRSQRVDLLRMMRTCLRRHGLAIVSTRALGDVRPSRLKAKPWRDGYLTLQGTFIAPINRTNLLHLADDAGLKPISADWKRGGYGGIIDEVLCHA